MVYVNFVELPPIVYLAAKQKSRLEISSVSFYPIPCLATWQKTKTHTHRHTKKQVSINTQTESGIHLQPHTDTYFYCRQAKTHWYSLSRVGTDTLQQTITYTWAFPPFPCITVIKLPGLEFYLIKQCELIELAKPVRCTGVCSTGRVYNSLKMMDEPC